MIKCHHVPYALLVGRQWCICAECICLEQALAPGSHAYRCPSQGIKHPGLCPGRIGAQLTTSPEHWPQSPERPSTPHILSRCLGDLLRGRPFIPCGSNALVGKNIRRCWLWDFILESESVVSFQKYHKKVWGAAKPGEKIADIEIQSRASTNISRIFFFFFRVKQTFLQRKA